MSRRIETLTADQISRMDGWADQWTAIGLKTSAADRGHFEEAARRCYAFAGVAWPQRVVWVSSPLELAVAAPVAALTLRLQHHGLLDNWVRLAIQLVTDAAMRDAVGDPPWDQLHPTLDATLDSATGSALRTDPGWDLSVRQPPLPAARADVLAEVLQGALGTHIHDAVVQPVARTLQHAVSPAVARLVEAAVGDVIEGAVGAMGVWGAADPVQCPIRSAAPRAKPCQSPGAALQTAVGRAVIQAECGALRSPEVTTSGDIIIRETVALAMANTWTHYLEQCLQGFCAGQFACGGSLASPALTSFYREVCGLELDDDLWARAQVMETLSKSVAWWYPHRDFVLACERPLVVHRVRDPWSRPRGRGSHRLHCDTGPALAWADGWGVHALNGQLVPFWLRHVVEDPQRITVQEINAESDPELVRLMIERYGCGQYAHDVMTRGETLRSRAGPTTEHEGRYAPPRP